MQSMIARLLRLTILLFAFAVPLLAQDTPTISITPSAGEVERAVFEIVITGLEADTGYTVEILFDADVVFSSEETSDADGRIPYPVSSTEGDQAGIYTIRVVSNGEIVANADFELTAAADGDEDQRGFLGDVTVAPETAPFGKVQKIRIAELEPDTQYTVAITASETLQVAYRRQLRSEDDGEIEIEVFAEEGDSPGLHEISVYDADGELIAEGVFTIEAPPERDVTVRITPTAVAAGQAVEIAVAGSAAFDSITAQITSSDGVLIDTVLARASSQGEVTLSFVTPSDPAEGEYLVDIFVEGEKLANATLTIGEDDPKLADTKVSVDPTAAPQGSEHTITVGGLAAEKTFTLIILDPAGNQEFNTQRAADADGILSLTISSTVEDDAGTYSIEVHDDESGDLLASATFEITADDAAAEALDEPRDVVSEDAPEQTEEPPLVDDASATISPRSAPIGSSHRITVRNLQARESVTIDVVFADASVYSTEKTADASGTVMLELFTSDQDEPGDYTIRVLREAGNQPSVVLTATARRRDATVSPAVGEAQVIEGNLTDGSAEIEFEGAQGRYVLLRVSSEDFDPSLALIDRDDYEIAFSDDSRGRKDAIVGPLMLPYSGRYNLEIGAAPLMMAQGAIDGDFVVRISSVSINSIAFEMDTPFALSAHTPALYFALPVETGDSLTARVDSGGALDTLLQVVSPAGIEYAFDDDSGSGFDAELSNLVFDHSASYILVVATFDDSAAGAGTITVSHNPVHALEDGETIVTLNDKAIRDLVVFDAEEDELLVLNLEKLAGDVEDLYVTATIEGMEVMAYSTMGVPEHLPLAFVTPMSGRVVVTLEKFGFDDAITLEVSLERP